jgi:hypothetical protein
MPYREIPDWDWRPSLAYLALAFNLICGLQTEAASQIRP